MITVLLVYTLVLAALNDTNNKASEPLPYLHSIGYMVKSTKTSQSSTFSISKTICQGNSSSANALND